MNSPVIAMRQAAVGYDERPSIAGVDLRIEAGEVIALVGPNGSGKTTLVRGVLGLARVLGGDVELFGVPTDRFRARYRIGYVPQRHTVVGAVPSTVEEVVTSGRLPRKRMLSRMTAADRAAVRTAIDAVGLTDRRRAAVSTLSGGQQRRTLIARALAAEPEVLIMDEPTAGVDADSRDRLVDTLAGLVDRGLTLLIVTHEVTPLLPILTRIVALEGGRLVHDGPADVPPAWAATPEGHDHDAGHDSAHRAPVAHTGPASPLRWSGWDGLAPSRPGRYR